MKICNKCFNACCDCKNKKTFECDELMVYVIKTLNLKGYKTAFCCAGHVRKNPRMDVPHIKTYILFKKIYDLGRKPPGFKLANEKKSWARGQPKRTYLQKHTEFSFVEFCDYELQTNAILKQNQTLVNWVKKLNPVRIEHDRK